MMHFVHVEPFLASTLYLETGILQTGLERLTFIALPEMWKFQRRGQFLCCIDIYHIKVSRECWLLIHLSKKERWGFSVCLTAQLWFSGTAILRSSSTLEGSQSDRASNFFNLHPRFSKNSSSMSNLEHDNLSIRLHILYLWILPWPLLSASW